MNGIPKIYLWLGGIFLFLLFSALMFRAMFVTFIDQHEFGYKFDKRTGVVTPINRTGYVVEWPIVVAVHTIDLRPMQVRINANSRVLNAKLVKFNPAGFRLFIKWHGRADYDVPALEPILMSYAYEGTESKEVLMAKYPFLIIDKELKSETHGTNLDSSTTSTVSDTLEVR